jgi:hypothetical protein
MVAMNPDQAFRAVLAFLDWYWETAGHPEEVGGVLTFSHYTPGEGTADPAMWYDWLAAIKQVQTGVATPDGAWRSLKPENMAPMDPEQAYLAMVQYITDYWNRVSRPADLGDLLGQMCYTPGTGTADPEMWKRWLSAVDKVQANR